jgi:phosphotransferase system HPr-like phosphotransfer protein
MELIVKINHDIDYAVAYRLKVLSSKFSDVHVTLCMLDKMVNAGDIFQVLSLAAKTGTFCRIVISGKDMPLALRQILSILGVPVSRGESDNPLHDLSGD